MGTLARAADATVHPRLAGFADAGLDWWLVRDDNRGAAAAAVAGLLSRSLLDRGVAYRWNAELRGSAESLAYAAATLGDDAAHPGEAAHERTTLTGLSDTDVLTLLDALSVAPLALLLSGSPLHPTGAAAQSLVLFLPAGAPWAALGWPPRLAMHKPGGLETATQPEPLPAAVPPPRRPRSLRVRRSGAYAAAAVVLLAAAGGTVAWRLTHGGGSPAPVSDGVRVREPPPPSFSPAPDAPSPVLGGAATYDPTDGEAVVFGGIGGPQDTWTWSGQRWNLESPADSPEGRYGAALAFDPQAKDVLLYGGRLVSGDPADDTWSWDGSTWTRDSAGSAGGPPGGEFPVMAWDAARGEMVLVAVGSSGATETWVWRSPQWERRTPRHAPPGGVGVAAYDPVSKTVLLLTMGSRNDPSGPSQTWSWDGSDWRQLQTGHAPTAAYPTAMGLDPQSGRLVLVTPARDLLGAGVETWTWDGRDWAQVRLPQADQPPAPLAAFTSDADGVLEVAGWSAPGSQGTLHCWAWTGRAWVRLAENGRTSDVPRPLPPPRHLGATAWDQARQQLVLFGGTISGTLTVNGGSIGPTPAHLADTWVLDQRGWTQMHPSTSPPSAGAMAYDPANHSVLMLADAGGFGSVPVQPATWSWDGSTWRALHPATEIPRGELALAMVADPAAGTVVAITVCCAQSDGAVGGAQRLSTWTWDGRTWTLHHPATQPGFSLQVRAAYDPRSKRVLAVEGSGAVAPVDTWAWDGVTWTGLHPVTQAVFDPLTGVLAGDEAAGTVVLLENRVQMPQTFQPAGGTQVFDGRTWTEHLDAAPSDVDTAFGSAAVYTDTRIGRLVVVSAAADDFSGESMWTGVRWLRVDLAPLG